MASANKSLASLFEEICATVPGTRACGASAHTTPAATRTTAATAAPNQTFHQVQRISWPRPIAGLPAPTESRPRSGIALRAILPGAARQPLATRKAHLPAIAASVHGESPTHLEHRRPVKRHVSGQHFVQHYPQRPQVGAGIRGLALQDFRRHVMGCSHHGPRGSQGLKRERGVGIGHCQLLRQPEIEHFHVTPGVHHDIARLDIAMQDALGVRGSSASAICRASATTASVAQASSRCSREESGLPAVPSPGTTGRRPRPGRKPRRCWDD